MAKWSLVDEWRDFYKWISVNCMVLAAAIQGAWMYVPEDLRAKLPEGLISGLTVALLILGVAGRLVKKQ